MSEDPSSHHELKPHSLEGVKRKVGEAYRATLAGMRRHPDQMQSPTDTEPGQKKSAGHRLLQEMSTRIPRLFKDRESSPSEAKSASPFDRELEDGTRIRDLMTPEGKRYFGEAIKSAGGKGLIIVHPYYELDHTLKSPERSRPTAIYTESLLREVAQHRERGDVLIVFEETYKNGDLDSILPRMGVTGEGAEVFIVPTKNSTIAGEGGGSPEPENGQLLVDLASELKDLGLSHATIGGMQFREVTWRELDPGEDRYSGCAGYTLERLKEAGIETSVAESVLDF